MKSSIRKPINSSILKSSVYIIVSCTTLFASYSLFASNKCLELVQNNSTYKPPNQTSKLRTTIPSHYVRIRHTAYTGMEHLPGQTTNIGKFAYIKHSKSGQIKEFSGRIIDEYQAGITIIDASGVRREINVNWGEIKEAYVEPTAYNWIKPAYGTTKAQLFDTIKQLGDLLGLVSIHQGKDMIDLYGELNVLEVKPGYEVISLRDSKGKEHLLDPDYIGTKFLFIQKSTESRQIFSMLSPSQRVEIIDKHRESRLRLVTQLIEDGRIYDNPKYYDYFSKDLANTKQLIMRWFPENARELINSVTSSLGEQYVVLLTDPGIAQRTQELVSFAIPLIGTNPHLTPWQLRELFSSHLGKIKVFRGMALTESEAKLMTANGIEAPGFQNTTRAEKSLFDTLDSQTRDLNFIYANNPRSEITARLTDIYSADARMFISVSKYKEVASSLGYYSSGKAIDNIRQLYIFEIEIPEISIIRQQGLFQRGNSLRKESFLTIGSNFSASMTRDLGIEMFVPYKINPENILNVTRQDSPPPKWKVE